MVGLTSVSYALALNVFKLISMFVFYGKEIEGKKVTLSVKHWQRLFICELFL